MLPRLKSSKFIIFVMMINFRSKTFKSLLQLFFMVLFPLAALSQSNSEMKKIFAKAESYNLFEEYELANPLYLLLEKPDNFNIKYKIGNCYLNIPGEKYKSVSYLEAAVSNSSYDSKPSRFKEKRAPLDAYFSLAKSYMINNDLNKALSTFYTFKKLALETEKKGGMKNLTYIDQQVEACQNALSNQEIPFKISKRILSSKFCQGSLNENPAVSFDGKVIVYTERRGLNNAIMFSRKINGKWQSPVEINSQLKSGEDCSSCSLNKDGTLLFIYKTDTFDGNIYSSEFKDGEWTPIKKLNKNINTKYYESHASISADGNKLYFTSNREGGKGGLDIYVSEKDAAGDWGIAVNLGNKVNTIYNDDTPFITLNDSLLYFSSEGHNGMGGYDVFRSQGNGAVWDTVMNMGFPVNSTDDDRFFQPFKNDENGFYSVATGYKVKDIFYVTLSNPRLNQVFEIKGIYSLRDTVAEFNENNTIYLINTVSGDTIDYVYPDTHTGDFNFIVAPGKFRLVFTGPERYASRSIDTLVLADSPEKVIDLKNVILEKALAPVVYEKLDLSEIPEVESIDSSILIKNLQVSDVTDNDMLDTTILYYTVQVMALYNPVDVNYFKYVDDIRVLFNENDQFYRYTSGVFLTKDEAYAHKNDLIRKGYPDDLFVKKVTRMTGDKPVSNKKYYTIQLKATQLPLDVKTVFEGLKGVWVSKEIDGLLHYFYGKYTSQSEAGSVLQRLLGEDYEDAYIREISVILKN